MPLNLGNVTQNVYDDTPFEDLYIDWLEADQQFMNLMNAYEIAEKAKATQSTECISFAEELLGCSCEVIIGNTGKERRAAIKVAMERTAKIFWGFKRQIASMIDTVRNDSSLKEVILVIPAPIASVLNIHGSGFAPLLRAMEEQSGSAKQTYWMALLQMETAARMIARAAESMTDHEDILPSEKVDPGIDNYMRFRKHCAKLIPAFRSTIRQVKQKLGSK